MTLEEINQKVANMSHEELVEGVDKLVKEFGNMCELCKQEAKPDLLSDKA